MLTQEGYTAQTMAKVIGKDAAVDSTPLKLSWQIPGFARRWHPPFTVPEEMLQENAISP